MVATLTLDTLTSSGAGITIPAGKTLTVEGVSVTAGSSNIQRATADVDMKTAAGYEVSGKSEVVVAANASASNRIIKLPDTTATGMSTCIITVIADADAAGTNTLKVQDQASGEIWTGYKKGDFVRLIVSNSAWLVVDHKETLYSLRYMAANQTISTSALEKLTGNGSGWTNVTESGNMFDNTTNYRIVMPFAGIANIHYFVKADSAGGTGAGTALKAGAAGSPTLIMDTQHVAGNGYHRSYDTFGTQIELAAGEVIEFWSRNSSNGGTQAAEGGSRDDTQFSCKVERVY